MNPLPIGSTQQPRLHSACSGRHVWILLCLLTLAVLQGCAINRESASISTDVDLSHLKRFYVVKFAPDQRGINFVIATQLNQLGFQASTGLETSMPKDVDAIVTYLDKWQWDITMYMIELKIFIREPQTDALLAVGNSMHTSLSRQTPEEMAAEVLANMFHRGTGTAPSNK
jgi:hypothetical protein